MSCFNRRVVSRSGPLEQLPELASRVCALAQQAGEKIMRFHDNEVSVTLKAGASPLTGAGVASHAFLVKSLQGLLPDVPVVSEESEGRWTALSVIRLILASGPVGWDQGVRKEDE